MYKYIILTNILIKKINLKSKKFIFFVFSKNNRQIKNKINNMKRIVFSIFYFGLIIQLSCAKGIFKRQSGKAIIKKYFFRIQNIDIKTFKIRMCIIGLY